MPRCQHCLVPASQVTAYEMWQSGCPATKTDDQARRAQVIAECARISNVVPPTQINPAPRQILAAPPSASADFVALKGRRKFLLTQDLGVGDWVAMTGMIRDLKLAYGDAIELDVHTSYHELFANSPRITKAGDKSGQTLIKPDYGAGLRGQKSETIHFLAWWHRDWERQTGIPVPVRYPYPDLHLTPAEVNAKILGDKRYWVFVAGGKQNFTAKWWARRDWQETCNLVRLAGIEVVQVGAIGPDHWHPALDGAINLVGKTDLRLLMRLIAQSEGVVCGVTGAMHLAAGLHKPCVVLAGGREAWWWEAYVNENRGFGPEASGRVPVPHKFLHTIGQLPCCPTHGCWRSQTESTNPSDTVCEYPEDRGPGRKIARCMTMIRPAHVLEAVMSYYNDRALPAIGALPDVPEVLTGAPAPAPASETAAILNLAPPDSPPAEYRVRRFVPQATPAIRASLPELAMLDRPIFDDQSIGGKFTIFVLCRGDHYPMQKTCLDGLAQTLPTGRAEVRVALVGVPTQTTATVERMAAEGIVNKVYTLAASTGKYPAMRTLFHDPAAPLATSYAIWADDDTYFDRSPNWLAELARTIATGHPQGDRLYGPHQLWQFQPGQVDWIRQSSWFRGRPLQDAAGQDAPNGQRVHFPAGGSFFALASELIRGQQIPDPRLTQDGAYMLAEQVHQGGGGFGRFSTQKQYVNWGALGDRGRLAINAGIF